ncbi:T9SS type A sorting domain-containing protein [Hymenobacter sp. HMF4947]|uniref:T9SS type A sorting domain-containing protein n=1 Tax=Hymenobacter ginkgonis TaxID=2682976 RepID=A0A7K1TDA0_9BACT|nr:FG-GAP-like repeat-containing protein [Hymenobacter ginkgonis]MVN76378.1 T9SS type A sorting domain-containing protein [Hymenobacter ginkgonis]
MKQVNFTFYSSLGFAKGIGRALLLSGIVLSANAAHAQAPISTSLVPLRNALAVPRTAPVAITFDQPLSTAAATQQALQVFSQQAGGQKAGPATVSGNVLTKTPSVAFLPGETIYVTLTTAAQSTGGQALARPQVYQFTTATTPSLGTFDGGSDLAVGLNPTSVAVGDVDGDGDLDLLTANEASSIPNAMATASVRINDGRGSFAGGQEVPVGRGPFQVVLADLDNDGDLDMLTANSADLTNQVSVRLNNGAGGFGTSYNLTGLGQNPHGLAVGDVNGDGRLDVLVAFYTDNQAATSSSVSVLLNNGTGTAPLFTASQDVAVSARPLNVALGDVDGDGDLDFVSASSKDSTASVRLNDGAGRFSGTQEVRVGVNPQTITLGDVDGDGDLDILTANYFDFRNPLGNYTSSTASVRRNDGRGNFSGTQEVALGQGARSLALGDVDGDGDLDLLATSELSNAASVRRNDGRGNFSATQEVAVGTGPYGLALGDVDGDGKLDLLTSNGKSNTVSVRLNKDKILATTTPQVLAELSIYPNPSAGAFALSYVASQPQAALLTLTDALGRRVQQQTLAVQAGANQVPVSVPGVAPGLYQLTLHLANGQRLSQKVSLLP